MKAAVAWFAASRPGRAWKRYTDARGNVLAAGVGYFAFFSIFPAAALAFSVFGFVLRGHPDLLHSILAQLGTYLPGFVKDDQHRGGLIPVQAPPALALTVTGVIAFVALVLAGLGWLGATREGIRAIFGAPAAAGNLIITKLRDLGVLFTLGLGIALFALLTSAAGSAAGWIAAGVGLSGQGWIFILAGFAVSVLADTGLMIVLLRVVSGVVAPWRELVPAAVVGGVGFSLLKISAATLLPRVTTNPLFASFAIVVGMLFWLNLIARLTLISAAWAANDVDAAQRRLQTQPPTQLRNDDPEARVEPVTFGGRSSDRTTLASGFILGAAAGAATRVLARGIRSIVRAARG
ncbi:MAG: rane protein [Actinomycetota bacterium]|nr:rane protein [Actinomycetota bacterium]